MSNVLSYAEKQDINPNVPDYDPQALANRAAAAQYRRKYAREEAA